MWRGVEPLSSTKLTLFQPPVKTEFSVEQRLALLEAEVAAFFTREASMQLEKREKEERQSKNENTRLRR